MQANVQCISKGNVHKSPLKQKMKYEMSANKATLEFVKRSSSSIKDSDVTVTDEEIVCVKKTRKKYSRRISWKFHVIIEDKPSADDAESR
jgi:hypothetical protein